MIYLDTNILVSLQVGDGNTAAAEQWYAQQSEPLAISAWGVAEFYAHLGLRCRKGDVTGQNAKLILDAFDESAAKNLTMLKNDGSTIELITSWLRNPDCNLQTGDALHLAIAHKGGATTLATLDDRFAKAAKKLKLHNLKIVLIPERSHKVEQKRATYKVDHVTNKKQTKKTVQRKKSK
jgi:predicted nucleic acid-binding protein